MDNKLHFSDGYKVIAEAKKDPSSVQLFECDGTYYVMTEDVEDYMCASMNTEISDAIADIAKANGVDSQTICCVGSFDEDFLPEIDDEDEDSIPDEDEEDDILEPSEEVEEGFSFKKKKAAKEIEEQYKAVLPKINAAAKKVLSKYSKDPKIEKKCISLFKAYIKKAEDPDTRIGIDANEKKELQYYIDHPQKDIFSTGSSPAKYYNADRGVSIDVLNCNVGTGTALASLTNNIARDIATELGDIGTPYTITGADQDLDEFDVCWFKFKGVKNESVESLDEAYEMLLEKSVEDGAMTLKQAEKTYNKILKTCKSEAETEKQLDDCIKTLNKCIDNMKAEKKKVEDGMKSKDQIKYSLKALIPFNSVYRMIKRNDWNIAGIAGDIANLFGAGRCLYITKKKL